MKRRGRLAGVALSGLLLATPSPSLRAAGALPAYGPRESLLRVNTTAQVGLLETADLNRDGLLDVVVARGRFQTYDLFPISILLNNGAGGLVDATASLFVGPPPLVQHPREMVIADFNGDGRPDIFIADHGYDLPPFPGYQNQLVLSTPDGRLVTATPNLPQQFDFTHTRRPPPTSTGTGTSTCTWETSAAARVLRPSTGPSHRARTPGSSP